VNRFHLRLGLIGALAAGLLLAGCGRKGPLDPPPANMTAPPAAQDQAPGASPASPPQTGYDESGQPVAPPGRRHRHFLDWLLD
jgi:predicted small lipoprotein YifL